MRRLRLAVFASLSTLGCSIWGSQPEPVTLAPLVIPPPEFRPHESDVPGLAGGERSGLWLAKWPIGSFYLFGSTEPVPEVGYASFGPTVAIAYAESQEVVHEVDLGAVEPKHTLALLRRYGTLRSPTTLKSLISPKTWTLLEETFAQSGHLTASVRSMQPWLVSFALGNGAPLRGVDPLPEIADRVHEIARSANRSDAKPVVGLRTLESQVRMFAALPADVQESLLRSSLHAYEKKGAYSSFDMDDWLRRAPGMLPQIASLDRERAQFYEHLIYRRNEQMAERLVELGIDGKVRFVEVGILHLVGKRGIPSLLAQHGFRVSRMQ